MNDTNYEVLGEYKVKWSYKGIPQAGQALGKLRDRVVKVK